MPSNSYINFLYLQKDVTDLTSTHFSISNGTPGRKYLGFLTRSAVIMLCAAWERYNEDLLLESLEFMLTHINDANSLPLNVQKILCQKIKKDNHELSPIQMTGDGWKQLWRLHATKTTESLNTPKSEQLNDMFLRFLGIPDYSNFWLRNSANRIDNFITLRGEIAHRGSHAQYVQMRNLKNQIELIISNAIEIDGKIAHYLRNELNIPDLPWQLDYYKTLEGYISLP
jgi:RiboL-PSP-HEPN